MPISNTPSSLGYVRIAANKNFKSDVREFLERCEYEIDRRELLADLVVMEQSGKCTVAHPQATADKNWHSIAIESIERIEKRVAKNKGNLKEVARLICDTSEGGDPAQV